MFPSLIKYQARSLSPNGLGTAAFKTQPGSTKATSKKIATRMRNPIVITKSSVML